MAVTPAAIASTGRGGLRAHRCRWCTDVFPIWERRASGTGPRRSWQRRARKHARLFHPVESMSVADKPLELVRAVA